jgi:hypothetical protein
MRVSRFLVFTFILCGSLVARSQGNLQFNQAILLSNSALTIPDGKVWKVEALFGHANNVCYFLPSRGSSTTYLVSRGRLSGFLINGVEVISSAARTDGVLYQNNNCTGGTSSYTFNDSRDNWMSDPNFFPMWLPEGTTVQTMGGTIFLSVIEFNIAP